MKRRVVTALLLVVGPVLMAAVQTAPAAPVMRPPSRSVWDSVFSADQAARGETAYVKSCARCHKASLGGADESPALAGSGFLANWNDQTLAALHDRIRSSMPPDDPGSYSRQLVTDVMAYILKVNGFPAGALELPNDLDSLKQIALQAAKP